MPEETKSPSIYYSVKNFELQRNVKEKTATSKQVDLGEGKIAHYESVHSVSGKLWQIFINESTSKAGGKYKTLSVTLKDGEQNRVIQMFFDSDEATSFFNRVKNVDTTKDVKIIVRKNEYTSEKSGKTYENSRVDVYQVNETGTDQIVPYFWNEKNPLPKWKEVTINQKVSFDKTEQLNLFEALAEEINTVLSGRAAEMNTVNVKADPLENGTGNK